MSDEKRVKVTVHNHGCTSGCGTLLALAILGPILWSIIVPNSSKHAQPPPPAETQTPSSTNAIPGPSAGPTALATPRATSIPAATLSPASTMPPPPAQRGAVSAGATAEVVREIVFTTPDGIFRLRPGKPVVVRKIEGGKATVALDENVFEVDLADLK